MRLLLPATPVNLPALLAVGESFCGDAGRDDMAAVRLWGEVKKALTATVLTEKAGAVRLVSTFERKVSLSGTRDRETWVQRSLGRGPAFAALPAAELLDRGFVSEVDDSLAFAAPDAALLLSDQFASTHCFSIVEGPGELGLSFSPDSRRAKVDVSGVLWVEGQTRELRRVVFNYAGLPDPLDRFDLGGVVRYARLAGGLWVVKDWYIRMPRLSRSVARGRERLEVVGYLDVGGVVGSTEGGRQHRAMLTGIVRDNLTGHGLAGVIARLDGARDSAVTDTEGRYTLASDSGGVRSVSFDHPLLAAFGLTGPRDLRLSVGDTVRVDLSTPRLPDIQGALCPSGGPGVFGVLFDPDRPTAGQPVTGTWTSRSGSEQAIVGIAGEGGRFALCGLPSGRRVVLAAEGRGSLGSVRLDRQGLRWLGLIATISGSSGRMSDVGGVVRGRVVDTSGLPVRGAEVLNGGTALVSTTDSLGRFQIAAAPGRQLLRVRRIGFLPTVYTDYAAAGDTIDIELVISQTALILEDLETSAAPRGPRGIGREALDERRRLGFGRVLDSAYLRRFDGLPLSDVVTRVQGVRIWSPPHGPDRHMRILVSDRGVLRMRGTACMLNVWIDGVMVFGHPGEQDSTSRAFDFRSLNTAAVESVEIFRSAAEIPPEYGGTTAQCGVALIWTRRD
ncbi:MAG: carboxypeptidase-like regulatory domain-containing protein [Gemmatimonadales bacterium]